MLSLRIVKNRYLTYQSIRKIKALQKMCTSLLLWIVNFLSKKTPVLVAYNPFRINPKNLAFAAVIPIMAVPIQEVQLLDYAMAHTSVNNRYGLTASTDDIYTEMFDKDPNTSDQHRERDEYEINDT